MQVLHSERVGIRICFVREVVLYSKIFIAEKNNKESDQILIKAHFMEITFFFVFI